MKEHGNNRVKRVALLVETTRSYTREMLRGVNRYIEERGPWSTFIELRSLDSSIPAWVEGWDGDGILTRTFSAEMAAAIEGTGVPTVELRSTNFNQSVPFVGMDNTLIGQVVADHFLNRGYRRFAAYTLETEAFFRERVRNFITRVEDTGADCTCLSAQTESSPNDWESHQGELVKWLRSLEKPVGIFATNDQLAVRVIDACNRAGFAVPEQVAVVGCENEETLCEFSTPRLTSVRFDGKRVGYEAAQLLDRMMDGEEVGREDTLIPPLGIVIRGSSDEWVIEDPVVARAVRLMRERAVEGITVGEICNLVSVSRSTLERRMKQTLKRGPKEELLRVRFHEVDRLLRNTDFTIERIAEMTGFRHAHYLQAAYKERFGRTPGSIRRLGSVRSE